jgi:hypothetical protein
MRRTDAARPAAISPEDLAQRIAAYRRARDRAVLRSPAVVRERFGPVWEATIERAVAAGVARFDDKGDLRIVKEAGFPAADPPKPQ